MTESKKQKINGKVGESKELVKQEYTRGKMGGDGMSEEKEMEEYLLDVSKNQIICVRELHDNCGCYRCREERGDI